MKNLGILLLFPLLAFWLPLQGERFVAHAASPEDNEDYEQPEAVEAAEPEQVEDQPSADADSSQAPVDALPLNAAENEESTMGKSRRRRHVTSHVTSSSPGTFRTLSLVTLVFGTALLLSVLVAKKWKAVELVKGTPPDLAKELKMALALLPEAKNLADAVAIPAATKAYTDAAQFVSEAEKASGVAEAEVGAAREKAIGEMRSRLDDAVKALKALHSETQLMATEMLEQLPELQAVYPWCEAAGKIAASTEHVKSAGNVLVSFESSAGIALLQARQAWTQLDKQSFDSFNDGEVFRQSLVDFMAVLSANKKVERLSEFAQAIQKAIFKAIQGDQELRRSATVQLLWEELSDAAYSCVKVFDEGMTLPSVTKNKSKLQALSRDFKAAVQLAREGASSLMAAHSKAVARIAVCHDPKEFRDLTEELQTLEEKVKAAVETLWESVRQQDLYRRDRLLQGQYEQRQLLRVAQNVKAKGENYKQLAMQRLYDVQSLVLEMLPEEQAGGTAPEYTPLALIQKLNDDVRGLGLMIENQEKKLGASIDRATQLGQMAVGTVSDMEKVIETLRKRCGEVVVEADRLITMCAQALHVHAEATFAAVLQAYMRATAQDLADTSVPEGVGPAAQQAQQLMQQYADATRAVQRAAGIPTLAEPAALMGLAVSKLGFISYQHQRGLFEGN